MIHLCVTSGYPVNANFLLAEMEKITQKSESRGEFFNGHSREKCTRQLLIQMQP